MAKMKNKEVKSEPQYIVVSDQRRLFLQDHVNEYLAKGYKPVGGVSVVSYSAHDGVPLLEFFQAMERSVNYFA